MFLRRCNEDKSKVKVTIIGFSLFFVPIPTDKDYYEGDPENEGLTRSQLRQKYGRSVFYDCLDASPMTATGDVITTPTEKQDHMKPDTENNTEDDRKLISVICIN